MSRVFHFDGYSGIDRVSGSALTNTNVIFKRTEKGMAGSFENAFLSISNEGQYSLQEFTVVAFFKQKILGYNGILGLGNPITTNQGVVFLADITGKLRINIGNGLGQSQLLGSTVLNPGFWYMGAITYKSGERKLYVNDNVDASDTLSNTIVYDSSNLEVGKTAGSTMKGDISHILMYDEVLTQSQITKIYEEFVNASVFTETNYWNGLERVRKPSTLNKDGLIAAYNMIPRSNGVLTDISESGNDGDIQGSISTLNGMKFDGFNDYITIGNIGNIKSIALRIKLNSITEKILEGAANDKLINSVAGVLSYTDYDTAYINSVESDAVVSGIWLNIVITSSIDVNNSAVKLGVNNVTYGNFEITDLRFYNRELTLQEAKDYHNSFNYPYYTKDFRYEGDGNKTIGHIAGTGTYEVQTVNIDEENLPLKKFGTKYYECVNAGKEAWQSKQAYGTSEFEIEKGAEGNNYFLHLLNTKKDNSGDGYGLLLDSAERISLELINSGAVGSTLFETGASYIKINKRYGIKKERLISPGTFRDIDTLQVSECENAVSPNDYTTFTNVSKTGFSAISDGSAAHVAGTADEISFDAGTSYLVEFDINIHSGGLPFVAIAAELAGSTWDTSVIVSEGRNSIVFTSTTTGTGVVEFYNLSDATDYTVSRLRISRVYDAGTFAVFIKGNEYGKVYQLIDVTGGSGSNPITDNTHTTSEYSVLDFDVGDKISNIRYTQQVEV